MIFNFKKQYNFKSQLNMSFKDELNAKVESFRGDIKNRSINAFIEILKSAMIEVAEDGKKQGTIDLDQIEFEFEDNLLYLIRHVLILTNEIDERYKDEHNGKVFLFLLKEVRKTLFFKDIYIEIDSGILEFNWFD